MRIRPLHDAADDSDAGDDDDDRAWPNIDHRDDDDVNDASTAVGADSYIRPQRNPNDRNADNVGNVDDDRAADNANNDHAAVSLSRVIQWFKIMTTTDYIRHVKQSAWPAFDRRVWQRGYYEHIIRDDESLDRLRRYIAANPARRDDLNALLARMEERI